MEVKISYRDTSLETISSPGVTTYATENKYLDGNLKVEFDGTDDATALASQIVKGKFAYIKSGRVEGELEEWDKVFKVYKPTELNPIANYTGKEITNGYTCPAGVNMTGQDRGTEVGTYTATYTPGGTCYWKDDGTQDTVEVKLTIKSLLTFTSAAPPQLQLMD